MRIGQVVIDITPLRVSRDFRLLFVGRTISLLSVGVLVVAVSMQVFEMTHSSMSVGLISLFMGLPMAVALIAGGVLADRVDRRLMMLWTRTAYLAVIATFLVNAAMPHPRLWVIYSAVIVAGVINGLSSPPLMAAMPALVGREHLVAAGALTTVTTQLGAIAGPSLAGVIAAAGGFAACYAVVAVGAVFTPICLYFLRPLPSTPGPGQKGFAAVAAGFSFVRTNRTIAGLLLIDVAATIFAMPQALLPQLGVERFHGGPSLIGLLYTAPAAGALVGAVASGWIGQFNQVGRALILTVLAWGSSMIVLGLSPSLGIALLALGAGGFANTTSEILRRALLQRYTPDGLQGRVGSLWLMQAIAGPSIGNVQAGFMAGIFSPGSAAVIGGLLCLGGTTLVAAMFPSLRQAAMNKDGSK